MIKQIVVLVMFLSTYIGFSQIIFEPGYIVNDNGNKIEVLIQNMDWHNNPKEVKYKRSENSEILTTSIEEIKEFKVANNVYERATLFVDQSSNITSRLSRVKDPDFLEETLLLRKIVGGKANLYEDPSRGYKYFYKVDDSPIQQLIYKRYITDGKIAHNFKYRQQLWTDLVCAEMDTKTLQIVDYNRNDLMKYFISYNKCAEDNYELYLRENREADINVNLKAGMDFGKVSVYRGLNAGGYEVNGSGGRVGLELEYVLNFNKNKWAVYAQPMYQYFTAERQVTQFNYDADLRVNYSFLELELGAKHYMFLNEKSKISLTAGFLLEFPVGANVKFENTSRNMDPIITKFESPGGLVLGIGYNYASKYMIEFRYALPRDIEGSKFVQANYNLEWRSEFTYASIVLGYNLF